MLGSYLRGETLLSISGAVFIDHSIINVCIKSLQNVLCNVVSKMSAE